MLRLNEEILTPEPRVETEIEIAAGDTIKITDNASDNSDKSQKYDPQQQQPSARTRLGGFFSSRPGKKRSCKFWPETLLSSFMKDLLFPL